MSVQFFWFFIAINIFVFPIVAINFLILKTPYVENIKPFVVTTGSMEPVIPTGSVIYAVKEKRYLPGDIITFNINKEAITHRIVKKLIVGGETYFATKGDANSKTDLDLIHATDIYGKTETIVPVVGRAVLFYKTPAGLFLGTLVPGLLLVLYIRRQNKYSLEFTKL
ncbi:MAG: signal peptidase I [Candidatus Levybacteria bacterium]|nr:signal peptidase I [Candidatus Levybacteria bacterium]